MNDTQPVQPPAPPKEEVSPDSLMQDFRGKPVLTIVIFTVIVHAVFLGAFSYGYIKQDILGIKPKQMTEEQRVDAAVAESTEALQDIADEYKIDFSVLTDRLGTGERSAPAEAEPRTATAPEPVDEREQAFEDAQEQAEGPQLPDLDDQPSIEEEDDLFGDQPAP